VRDPVKQILGVTGMVTVHHRTVSVNGHDVFYREVGPEGAPVFLLLHGYPTSSHMFRHLIRALADKYRVIAPDHIGFGRSSAPSVKRLRLHIRVSVASRPPS
jgi:pimeloyl-ACP methyl ester carboxylesterase